LRFLSSKTELIQAAPAALATIAHHFPNAMQDEMFVHAVATELFNLGFSRYNILLPVQPIAIY
jgi:hypothetical protein